MLRPWSSVRRSSGLCTLWTGELPPDPPWSSLADLLSSFSAALMGLPKLLKDTESHCEFPNDIDEEYVTEKGFQPCLPGEATKLSNALALFRAARTLSKVLEQNYPSMASYDLSLQSLGALEAELDEWRDNLPAHLKLTFAQDKPSTDITGSRSALLVSFQTHPQPRMWSMLTWLVFGLLLYSHVDPSSCNRILLRQQSLRVRHVRCRLQQAHDSNCSIARGTKYDILILPEQG